MSGESNGRGGGAILAGGTTTGAVAVAQQAGVLPRTGASVEILAAISIICGLVVFASQLYTAHKKRSS